MIVKTTWEKMLEDKQTMITSLFGSTSTLRNILEDIDSKYEELLPEGSSFLLTDMLDYVYGNILTTSDSNIWNGMKLTSSSFLLVNKLPLNRVAGRLIQHAGFYKKILDDSGFTKKLTVHRLYYNKSDYDGTNKGYNSETPQIELNNFDDAIKFASSLDKATSEQTTENNGESTITTDSKTFDESVKNTKMIFFNELMNEISEIAQVIYSEYSLSSQCVPELIKQTLLNIRASYEQTRD